MVTVGGEFDSMKQKNKSVELKAFVDTIGIKSADLKLFHASDMFVGYSFEMWAERF